MNSRREPLAHCIRQVSQLLKNPPIQDPLENYLLSISDNLALRVWTDSE